jgi:hypothetical protein
MDTNRTPTEKLAAVVLSGLDGRRHGGIQENRLYEGSIGTDLDRLARL